jgi:SAM-dependent methyltransferase
MTRVAERLREEEWLEAGRLRPEEVAANLRDLALINRWLGGAGAVIGHVAELMGEMPAGGPVRIVDVACGGGDLLRMVVDRARRMRRGVLGVGIDVSEQVLSCARARAASYPELRWVRADALALPLAGSSFDIVLCSSFLHHLEAPEAVGLIGALWGVSRRAVVVSDLLPCRSARVSFGLFCRLARLHPVTRHDGLVSLRRARGFGELAAIARAALGQAPFGCAPFGCAQGKQGRQGRPRQGASHPERSRGAAGAGGWQLHRHAFCRATLVCREGGGAPPAADGRPTGQETRSCPTDGMVANAHR